MKRSREDTSARGIKTQYKDVVLLEYISHNPMVGEATCPVYLKSELDLGSFYSASSRLIRKQYCRKRKKLGYIVTDKGRRLLRENQDYIKFFNFASPYIDIVDYQNEKHPREDDYIFESTMIMLHLEMARDFMDDGDYESAKELYLDAGVLFAEAGRGVKALYYHLMSLLMEINCAAAHEALCSVIERKCGAGEAERQFDMAYRVQPRTLAGIRRHSGEFDERLIGFLFKEVELPLNYCSESDFCTLVRDIIEEKYNPYQWKSHFLKAYKQQVGY